MVCMNTTVGDLVVDPKLRHLKFLNDMSLTITSLNMFIILMKDISSEKDMQGLSSKRRF